MRVKQYATDKLGIDIKSISSAALQVAKQLKDNGYEAFLVGGAVRDLLLGHPPKDFDVATNARPEQIKRLFKRAWIIGRRFRLVHVRIRDQLIDVATFRKAAKRPDTLGNGMVTEDNTFGNVEEDAYRRDITMNALLLDPVEKSVYDYTGGLEDLRNKCLRIIGDPAERYREDPVRILRILRLAGKLGCTIDKQSLRPISKLIPLLQDINNSRLFEEVSKVVFSKASLKCFKLFQQHGALKVLFPHMLAYRQSQLDFCYMTLKHADRLMSDGQRLSLTYVISSLYWPVISERFKQEVAQGNLNKDMMEELYLASGIEENQILSRMLRSKVASIWDCQMSFHRKYKKRNALTMQANYSSAKALLFLRLRHEAGEIERDLFDWWRGFLAASKPDRHTMVPPKQGKKRQRKRSDDATEQPQQEDPSD